MRTGIGTKSRYRKSLLFATVHRRSSVISGALVRSGYRFYQQPVTNVWCITARQMCIYLLKIFCNIFTYSALFLHFRILLSTWHRRRQGQKQNESKNWAVFCQHFSILFCWKRGMAITGYFRPFCVISRFILLRWGLKLLFCCWQKISRFSL